MRIKKFEYDRFDWRHVVEWTHHYTGFHSQGFVREKTIKEFPDQLVMRFYVDNQLKDEINAIE